jgi:hypothetical protein
MIRVAVSVLLLTVAESLVPSGVRGGVARETAQQSSSAAVVAQIEQMEHDRIRINVRKNMAALAAVTADDYVQIDWTGKVLDKAATLERIKSSDMQSHSLEDLKVRVYGNTAIVVGTAIRKGVTGDRDISGTFRYTRVYVNRDARWQVVHFQQTRVTSSQ